MLAVVDGHVVITTDREHDMAPDARDRLWLNVGQRHLYVIGPSDLDLVGCVGGWIFDRAMAGWTVKVVVPDLHDDRALRILGAQTEEIDTDTVSAENCRGHAAFAVAVESLDNDKWVRGLIARALDEGSCGLAIWGNVTSAHLPAGLAETSYRLSGAAAAFKKQAMTAATSVASPNVSVSEIFYASSGLQWSK